ncbi:hypothetical protein CDAR_18971 [Caerostris darwini]|uniref:Uncharacterized protein n=1 Tax=Caerostris darwini TaxID=1538125 RepID=A0AAV4WDQ7_9ARAC|nr:hypothetical protein CDAR_18971 [Caerostris darwini]
MEGPPKGDGETSGAPISGSTFFPGGPSGGQKGLKNNSLSLLIWKTIVCECRFVLEHKRRLSGVSVVQAKRYFFSNTRKRVSIRRTFLPSCPRNKQSGNKKQTRGVLQKEMAKQVVLQFQDLHPFREEALRGSEGPQE